MIYTITFEQRAGNGNFGKIVLAAIREAGDDVQVNVFVDFSDPTGAKINTYTAGTADIEANAGVGVKSVKTWDIPTDNNGDKLRGTYVIRIYEEQTVTSPGNEVLQQAETYYFQALENPASLNWDALCVPGKVAVLTLTDEGNYAAITEVSRELKVVHPAVTGIADTTTGGTSIQVLPTWSNVDYTGSVSVQGYITEDDGDIVWYEQYLFAASETFTFLCSNCDVEGCVREYMEKFINKTSISADAKNNLVMLQMYLSMYRISLECNRQAEAASWAEKIKQFTGCECGCADGDDPVQITTTLVVAGGDTIDAGSITVVDAGGNYVGSDLETILTEIAALINGITPVAASDVSVLDTAGYFSGSNVEDVLAEIQTNVSNIEELTTSNWTLFTNANLNGSWDTETYPSQQLKWRNVGGKWIEIIGRIGSTGLASGTGSIFLTGYSFGVSLEEFYEFPVTLVANGGSPQYDFGGLFFVNGSGQFNLYVSSSVTPSGQAWFAIKAMIPIV